MCTTLFITNNSIYLNHKIIGKWQKSEVIYFTAQQTIDIELRKDLQVFICWYWQEHMTECNCAHISNVVVKIHAVKMSYYTVNTEIHFPVHIHIFGVLSMYVCTCTTYHNLNTENNVHLLETLKKNTKTLGKTLKLC